MSEHKQVKSTEGVVTSDAVYHRSFITRTFARIKNPASLRRVGPRSRLVLLALLVVIAVGGVLYWRHAHHHVPLQAPSLTQAHLLRVQRLQQNQPSTSASLDTRLAYYDNLAEAYANANNYKAAANSMNKRISISNKDLDYLYYYRLANYDKQIGDKAGALKALNQLETVLPPDNPDSGFSRTEVESSVNAMRQELSK